MSILEAEHICKTFNHTEVLKDISFSLEKGQALSIIGSSGSGKTTLLRCLNFLETPDKGVIRVNGETLFDADDPSTRQEAAIRKKRLHFGLVFQSFNLISRTSALKNVELPMTYARVGKRARRERALKLLDRVGLLSRAEHLPNELSGGQRQRVAIARALANEPPLILADEPTGNLDTAASEEIMGLFSQLHKEGATVVVVTHEENIAEFTDRIIRFQDGLVISDYRRGGAEGAV